MPTYDYRCPTCGFEVSIFQTIGEYVRAPIRPGCCVPEMERKLSVNPAMSGLANALAGDRHYDGLAATDGTPINSRTKHRQYMKEKGLAMVDDFKQTWKAAAKEREARRMGKLDPEVKKIVSEEVMKAVAQPGD
jgi:putative FmdB family regulatory protein